MSVAVLTSIFESLRDEYRPHPNFKYIYIYIYIIYIYIYIYIYIGQGRLFEVEEYGSWGCGVKNTGVLSPTKGLGSNLAVLGLS